jgi:hypothetical protein
MTGVDYSKKITIIEQQFSKMDPKLAEELIQRIEYISKNLPIVPRIRKRDYIIAAIINAALLIAYFTVILI